MNKNETKYQNTALLMDEALLLLLEKKEYPYITVKEICQKAGVNRSTFYLHYETIDDLLKECIEMLYRRFDSSFAQTAMRTDNLSQLDRKNSFLITPEYLKPYLTFIEENKRTFALVVKKPELFGAHKTFEKMYTTVFSPILDKFGIPKEDKPYVFEYYYGAVMSVVMKWLFLGCKRPIDEMVELITSLLPPTATNKK